MRCDGVDQRSTRLIGLKFWVLGLSPGVGTVRPNIQNSLWYQMNCCPFRNQIRFTFQITTREWSINSEYVFKLYLWNCRIVETSSLTASSYYRWHPFVSVIDIIQATEQTLMMLLFSGCYFSVIILQQNESIPSFIPSPMSCGEKECAFISTISTRHKLIRISLSPQRNDAIFWR